MDEGLLITSCMTGSIFQALTFCIFKRNEGMHIGTVGFVLLLENHPIVSSITYGNTQVITVLGKLKMS